MRRILASVALVAMSAFVTGCALTDYCYTAGAACSQRVNTTGVNDAALGCAPSTIQALGNPQRPLYDADGVAITTSYPMGWLDQTKAMLLLGPRAITPPTQCQWSGTFGPPVSSAVIGNPSDLEAQSWMGQLGPYAFVGETQVFSPTSLRGTYLGAGLKSLGLTCDPAVGITYPTGGGGSVGDCGNNGSGKTEICHVPNGNPSNAHALCVGNAGVCAHLNNHEGDRVGACGAAPPPPGPVSGWQVIRLANYFRCPPEGCGNPVPSGPTGPFSFSCIATQVDGIYGGVDTQNLGDSQPTGILSSLGPDTIVLDTADALGWGRNIRAVTPRRQQLGYSVFVGLGGRGGEGRHEFVMPTAGASELFGGAQVTISAPNDIPLTLDVTATVREDGLFDMSLHAMQWQGSRFVPSSPILITTDAALKRFVIGREGHEAEQELAIGEFFEWFGTTVPMDEPFDVSGVIPELGLSTPNVVLDLQQEWFLRMADQILSGGDGGRRSR